MRSSRGLALSVVILLLGVGAVLAQAPADTKPATESKSAAAPSAPACGRQDRQEGDLEGLLRPGDSAGLARQGAQDLPRRIARRTAASRPEPIEDIRPSVDAATAFAVGRSGYSVTCSVWGLSLSVMLSSIERAGMPDMFWLR